MRTVIATTVLALLAAAAAAQTTGGPGQRLVTVVGESEASAPPDLAVLTLAVETEAATAAQAAASNAERADGLRERLEGMSSVQLRVSTSGYSLEPVYAPQPRGDDPDMERGEQPPKIRGYRAYNEVRVEIRDLAAVGRVLDAAVASGANRVVSLLFLLEQREAALREALTRAGREARAQADAVAAALDVRLGPVASAHAGGGGPIPMPMRQMAAMEMAVSTPIEPGVVTVRATLTVSYQILD
jgi:uncharacterized protein